MLLLGMIFSKVLCPDNNAFYEKLKQYRISGEIIILTRIISVFVMYIIIAISGFCIYVGISKYLGADIVIFKIRDYLLLLFVILCVVSFVVCIFTITKSQISGSLLLFISTLVMNFISGGFIPTVFLPKPVQSLTPFMLTNVLSKQVGTIFLDEFDMKGFIRASIILIALYFITVIIVNIKDRRWDFNSGISYGVNEKFMKIKGYITKKVGK